MVLTCGDAARRWGDLGEALGPGATRVVAVPERPGRPDVDPALEGPALDPRAGAGGGLGVAGTAADLAAVLVRLLRTERLGVPVAFLPAGGSEAARVWGLPDGRAALDVARTGVAGPAPLLRDDRGGVVAGAHVVGAFHGVVYCDEHEVLRGVGAGLVVRPEPEVGVTVSVTGPRRLAGLRPGAEHRGRGRAATIGCRPAALHRDGVPDDRLLERRSWYRHTADWTLVRPDPGGSDPA